MGAPGCGGGGKKAREDAADDVLGGGDRRRKRAAASASGAASAASAAVAAVRLTVTRKGREKETSDVGGGGGAAAASALRRPCGGAAPPGAAAGDTRTDTAASRNIDAPSAAAAVEFIAGCSDFSAPAPPLPRTKVALITPDTDVAGTTTSPGGTGMQNVDPPKGAYAPVSHGVHPHVAEFRNVLGAQGEEDVALGDAAEPEGRGEQDPSAPGLGANVPGPQGAHWRDG